MSNLIRQLYDMLQKIPEPGREPLMGPPAPQRLAGPPAPARQAGPPSPQAGVEVGQPQLQGPAHSRRGYQAGPVQLQGPERPDVAGQVELQGPAEPPRQGYQADTKNITIKLPHHLAPELLSALAKKKRK